MGVDGLSKADIFDEYFDSDKIPSFQRSHIDMEPGLYLQEHKRNILTYDLRFVKPNTRFIPIEAIHTIEHLFATWLKTKSEKLKDIVISFNPGGCQTMFYLEVFDDMLYGDEDNLDDFTMNIIARELCLCTNWCMTQTEVPGATENECGNYKSHDLLAAQSWLAEYNNLLVSTFFE